MFDRVLNTLVIKDHLHDIVTWLELSVGTSLYLFSMNTPSRIFYAVSWGLIRLNFLILFKKASINFFK